MSGSFDLEETSLAGVQGLQFEPLCGETFAIAVSAAHTFGTDAFLLADFAAPRPADVAVDLGCGCGIIPFLWLRDGRPKGVTGIDVSPEAIRLCRQSAQRLCLEQQFVALEQDLKTFGGETPFGPATLVTCNPPYTEIGHGPVNRQAPAAAARHGVRCTFEEVAACAGRLLKTGGRFCLCQRPAHLPRVIAALQAVRLEPKRLRLVAKQVGAAPWLFLLEARKDGNSGLTIEATEYLYDTDGQPSEAYKRLYRMR